MIRLSLLIFCIFFIVGIILIPLTYIVSNQTIYSHQIHLEMGDYSGNTIPLPIEHGKIRITGNINGSVELYLVNRYLGRESYLGNFSGYVNIITTDNNYDGLFIFNNLYPSNVTLSIFIYNTSFVSIGYPLAGIFLAISLLLGFYIIKTRQSRLKIQSKKYPRRKGKE